MADKTANQYKKAIKRLSGAVIAFEDALDKEMKKQSTPERGKNIAKLMNALTLENQQVMRFALGYSFGKIEKLYSDSPNK